MRILIVAPEQIPVPPVLGGSVEISILALAKELARRHEVTVVSRRHKRYGSFSRIDGVAIHRVPTGSPAAYLSQVKRWLAGRKFDRIQIDNRPRFVGPIKRMCPDTPVSLFLHSLTFVSPPYLSRASAARCLSKADLIVANSASLQSRLSARFPAVAGKIRKMWLGVDTARFTPKAGSSASGAFTVLFAGRIIPRKGVPVLLKAVKLARARAPRPIRVILAGGSPNRGYMRRMKRLSARLGIRARFLGTVPHRRIHRVYQQADAFVCPSQKHEAFGLVNVEAMSAGLPVIASSNGGIKEIVRHYRNGLLVSDYRNPKAFADAIVLLMSHRELYERLRRQAREDCLSRFSWGAAAQRLGEIYESGGDR
jgi:spore coat protein SA